MPQFAVSIVKSETKVVTVEADDETEAGDIAVEYVEGFLPTEEEDNHIIKEEYSGEAPETTIESIEYIK